MTSAGHDDDYVEHNGVRVFLAKPTLPAGPTEAEAIQARHRAAMARIRQREASNPAAAVAALAPRVPDAATRSWHEVASQPWTPETLRLLARHTATPPPVTPRNRREGAQP